MDFSYFDAGFITFLIAITLLTMAPGVDTVLVIRNTLRGGKTDGLVTSFAICCGLFVHAVVSAAGISLILLQSATLFTVLKLAGAAYLIWLGAKSLWGALQAPKAEADGSNVVSGEVVVSKERALNLGLSFREGFLSNVLNPKTVVFYMAFLPQFIQPEESALYKSLFLASVHFVIANIWQLLLIMAVARAQHLLQQQKVMRWIDGVIGSIMAAFGIKLAADL
ncbi:resistance to homoserine/threonine (RhtB) family protein [Oceanospirillum multiglobuliferum]|nr:LysE family translocator [Oceanospirillum multiglobuliferum]SJZ51009.1 resistance to homoserine/threonine (RhtB) family protein [Oceanospirillum multiglobuliferum]